MAKSNHKLVFRQFKVHSSARALGVAQDVAVTLGSRVVTRTPELTSRARANWESALNTVPQEFDEAKRDPGGFASIERVKEIAQQMKLGSVFVIANSAYYIGLLENGFSKKAPNGMVAITSAEFPFIVERALRNASTGTI
jgi:hypothetical protein